MSIHELIDEFLRLKRDVKTLSIGTITTANIPLFIDEEAITIPQASSISDGYLSAADFTTFSNSALWEVNASSRPTTIPAYTNIEIRNGIVLPKGTGGGTPIAGGVIYENVSGTLRAYAIMSGASHQSVAIGSRGLADKIAANTWLPTGIGETVSIGEFAGAALTTGGNNVFIGKAAGNAVTTGSGNILIGRNVIGSAAATDTLQLGGFIYGSGNITTAAISIGSATVTTNLILSLTSTTKAFAPPRMTTTQRDAIATPTAGMQIYDTTVNKMSVHDGTSWRYLVYE